MINHSRPLSTGNDDDSRTNTNMTTTTSTDCRYIVDSLKMICKSIEISLDF
jgi:hypothetical protein